MYEECFKFLPVLYDHKPIIDWDNALNIICYKCYVNLVSAQKWNKTKIGGNKVIRIEEYKLSKWL